MGEIKKIDGYFLIFIATVLFYCLVLAHIGFEFWDTGYIPSFSWRIVTGENVYEDFLYKGPPVTLYFHSFFMKFLPEMGQFYWIRVTNYLMFGIQVFFTVTAFDNFYGLQKLNINKWAIMTIGFVISLLNFPPYPWPTTDGLFFASLALFFSSKIKENNTFYLILIALFSVLSALTKQSFYLIPIFFIVFITIQNGIKKGLMLSLFISFFIALFLYWITTITTLDNFLKQTTGQTHLKDLLYAGFLNYFWIYDNKIQIYVILFFAIVLSYYFRFKNVPFNFKKWFEIVSAIVLLFSIGLCFSFEFLIASRIAAIACVFGLLSKIDFTFESFKYYLPSLLLLGTAWCSAISLGYPFPILYTTGIILSLILIFQNQFEKITQLKFFLILLLSLLAVSHNYKPYREQNISKISSSLNEIAPKLNYIYTTKDNLKKLKELKSLRAKYGLKTIVAPNMAMTNYIFNSKSLFPADWIINTEVNRDATTFINIAAKKENYLFIEKSFINGEELMPSKRENFSIIADYIYKNFNKIQETEHFIVYNGLKTNERLPKIN
ncbi:hypothetical protein [Flavobacterium sp.]|uniref:hypothetical protein n=1 Tax=Flavobacterium sp. TaxID=239 RepID=UPI00261D5236|nr:hypothetical protein [Flavobacterium sp.]